MQLPARRVLRLTLHVMAGLAVIAGMIVFTGCEVWRRVPVDDGSDRFAPDEPRDIWTSTGDRIALFWA
jgi:hypothetical protein